MKKNRGQTISPLKERLSRLSVKDEATGCINFTSTTRNGYGRLIVGSRTTGDRRSVSAHRLAYELYIGKIPKGMEVCHKCDNRKCINPEHLFAGTHQDNINDREAKGRNVVVVGEKRTQSKITEEIAIKVKSLLAAGVGPTEAARRLGISVHIAKEISYGRTWKHVSATQLQVDPQCVEASQ